MRIWDNVKESTPEKLYGRRSWNFAQMILASAFTKMLFYWSWFSTLVAMATYSVQWLLMENLKNYIYCYLFAGMFFG